MDADTYANFTRAQGYKVIKTENCYWYNYRPFFYKAIPEFDTHRPIGAEIRYLFKKCSFLGCSYVTDKNRANLYTTYLVNDNHNFDLQSIRSKPRNQVRRGLEKCDVKKISFELLDKYGIEINDACKKLLADGVVSFEKSFDSLLKSIEKKASS